MSDYLPEAVRKGLEEARVAVLRKSGRLCVHDGDAVHRIFRLWDGGFAMQAVEAPRLRGLVDLYDGPRHVMQCLVVASHEEEDLMIYDFKRATQVADRAAVDFAHSDPLPVALIPRLL
ncbi:MAG: hypothetical protein P8N72_14915 [Flavimaricola sp.]|nr:hypothetical protein [Flavimaricola sp.]